MLFNSWQFALFFPVVTAMFFALPHRARWVWLLLASCVFYMAFVPAFILILAFTIGVDYVAGIAIANAQGPRRKHYLLASLVANLGTLAFFKYFNFFNANVAALAGLLHWNYPVQALNVLLPIGLSFHVFQSLSYTLEVYRGNQAPERHLGIFALYVMFYPQLVAGPIERPQQLLPQLHAVQVLDGAAVSKGLRRMAWGLFKKTVIADRIAPMVAPVFAAPAEYGGLTLAVSAVLFTIQIYCDFSGYTDLALGAAEVMGFTLMENFKQPFTSRSVQEFWTRWHISLSSWFNDYLFTPLAFHYKQHGKTAIVGAALVTFGLSGLWHGAGWNFVVFGLLHGLAVSFDVLAKKARKRLGQRLPGWFFEGGSVGLTFAFVCFAFIFFRSPSLAAAVTFVSRLVSGLAAELSSRHAAWGALARLDATGAQLVIVGLAIALLEAVHWVQRRPELRERLETQPNWLRWPVYSALVWAIVLLGAFKNQAFIYFQF